MPGLLIIGALLSAKAGFQIYAIWHRVDRYYENKCATGFRIQGSQARGLCHEPLPGTLPSDCVMFCDALSVRARACLTGAASRCQVLLAAPRPHRAACELTTAYSKPAHLAAAAPCALGCDWRHIESWGEARAVREPDIVTVIIPKTLAAAGAAHPGAAGLPAARAAP